jgi:hypothetical protein
MDELPELPKIEQAIQVQENLRGILPDNQIDTTLASLRTIRDCAGYFTYP